MFDLAASLEAVERQNAEGCVKTWEDLDRYRTIIDRVRPTLIIECGTFSGKSALWFAQNSTARVVTIDTDPHVDPDTAEALRRASGVFQLQGSSLDENLLEFCRAQAQDSRVLVSLDSDHSGPHVLVEMEAYGPLVTPGSYMVVEDTLLRWMSYEERAHYDLDPLWAVDQFLPRSDWIQDDALTELHPVTQFPGGWLRKR